MADEQRQKAEAFLHNVFDLARKGKLHQHDYASVLGKIVLSGNQPLANALTEAWVYGTGLGAGSQPVGGILPAGPPNSSETISFRSTLPPEKIAMYRDEYSLTYQLDFLHIINSAQPLRGMRVLEVGGTNLARSLVLGEYGAKQWVCMAPFEGVDPRPTSKHHRMEQIFGVGDDWTEILATDYAIVDGDVNKLRIFDHFDVVISIAAFEHVLVFGGMLERIYDSLRPGGHLESLFMPIWPCSNGHHLWAAKDKAGNEYNFGSYIIPPWGHLLMSPPELRRYLLTKTDADCADDIVYKTYHEQSINRLFVEDYEAYLKDTRFKTKNVFKFGQRAVPEPVQSNLVARYPGRTQFDTSTLFMRATK